MGCVEINKYERRTNVVVVWRGRFQHAEMQMSEVHQRESTIEAVSYMSLKEASNLEISIWEL